MKQCSAMCNAIWVFQMSLKQSFPISLLISKILILKTYAEENDLLKQPQRKMISSFKLTNGTLITPLLNVSLDFGLQCTKIHRFVQYTSHKVFNSFVQSVVDAWRWKSIIWRSSRNKENSRKQSLWLSMNGQMKSYNDKKCLGDEKNH